MASTAGRELMNSEVRGSDITLSPQKGKKGDISLLQEIPKLGETPRKGRLEQCDHCIYLVLLLGTESGTNKIKQELDT